MPLTDVGKIFKPELRKRASRQVYFEIVQAIAGAGSDPELEIVSDPVHGTLVSVTLSRIEDMRDRDVERRLRSALEGFTCAHRISWR